MDKVLFKFGLSWANVIVYSFFITYGYFGAVTFQPSEDSSSINIFFQFISQLLLILIPLISFSLIANLNLKKYKDTVSIYKEDIAIFFFFLLFFSIIIFDRLNFALYSDEISYVGTAHRHAIYLLYELNNLLPLPGDFNFQYLVQLTSIILFFGLVIFFLVINRLRLIYKVIIIIFLLTVIRYIFLLKSLNGSPHPPLHLVPSFFFGSFFGIKDLVFRFGHLIVFSLFTTILYRLCRRAISREVSILLAMSVSTIPLILEISPVIEHSIWSYYFLTIIMLELMTSSAPNYLRLVAFISVGSLMRQPILLALLPVFFHYIFDNNKLIYSSQLFKKSLLIASPILLFLPFLIRSIVYGTPATGSIDNTPFIFERLIEAIQSEIIYSTTYNAFPFWWILITPLAFLLPYKERKDLSISFFILFLGLFIIFNTITPGLWTYHNYQVEKIAPFMVVGIVNLVIFLESRKNVKPLLLIFLVLIVIMNITEYKKTPVFISNQSVTTPFNYSDAYKYIISEDLTSSTYSIGSTYGIMPEIMNGYSTTSIFNARDIYLSQKNIGDGSFFKVSKIETVVNDPRISAILIGLVPNKELIIESFLSYGWSITREFNNGFDSSFLVIVMER